MLKIFGYEIKSFSFSIPIPFIADWICGNKKPVPMNTTIPENEYKAANEELAEESKEIKEV